MIAILKPNMAFNVRVLPEAIMEKETKWLWVDEKKVFAVTGRALPTLRNDRSLRRGIPFSKIGKSVKYRMSDVIEYMEKHRVETE
jgi:hypothetical protein